MLRFITIRQVSQIEWQTIIFVPASYPTLLPITIIFHVSLKTVKHLIKEKVKSELVKRACLLQLLEINTLNQSVIMHLYLS